MEIPNLSFSPWVIPAAAGIYGLIHSVMASLPFKQLVNRIFGELANRYYRLFYSMIAILTLLPVLALTFLIPDQRLYTIPSPWVAFTVVVQLLSLALLAYSVMKTGAMQFVGISQAFGLAGKERLYTGGLYRVVRHPLYTFSLLFIWLTPIMTRNLALLYAALTVYILIGAIFEERKLSQMFGKDYQHYRARTPFIIPFIL